MLEIDPIYLILLTEGFGLLSLAFVILLVVVWLRRSQHRAVIADLTARLKAGSSDRRQKTELFLQAAYDLEGEALRDAAQAIELRETEFLQHLIEALYRINREQMKLLDMSLDTMIDSYKRLEPRVVDESGIDPMARQVEELLEHNERLREELSIAKNTMSQMVAEFAEMFGGGHEHRLSVDQVKEKFSTTMPDIELGTQK